MLRKPEMRHDAIAPVFRSLLVAAAVLSTGCSQTTRQGQCNKIAVEERTLIGTVRYAEPAAEPIETNFAHYPAFQVEPGDSSLQVVAQGNVVLQWDFPASAPPNSNPREFWLFMTGIDTAGKKELSEVRATFCTCAKGSNLNFLTRTCQWAEDDLGHCEEVEGTLDITELDEACAAAGDVLCEEHVEMTLEAPMMEGKRFSGIIRWRSHFSEQTEACTIDWL